MGIDFSTEVLLPNYNLFARPVVFVAGPGRGIYGTVGIEIPAEDGSLISDQRTILDIREAEFGTLPVQGERLTIPADGGVPALGEFEVTDLWSDGGGETTLALRRVVP